MVLLIETTETVFDTDSIHKGDLICAKHKLWDESLSGLVMYVDQEKIRVLYRAGIANVTHFYTIPVSEVKDGEWEVRWSKDLQEIESYIPEGEKDNDV